MTTAMRATKLIGFFIVDPFGFSEVRALKTYVLDKSNALNGLLVQNVSTIRSSIFRSHGILH
jgi:hypothetical protein